MSAMFSVESKGLHGPEREAKQTAVLSWTAALELGSQLQHAAIRVEPPAPPGKRYEPATERDR